MCAEFWALLPSNHIPLGAGPPTAPVHKKQMTSQIY